MRSASSGRGPAECITLSRSRANFARSTYSRSNTRSRSARPGCGSARRWRKIIHNNFLWRGAKANNPFISTFGAKIMWNTLPHSHKLLSAFARRPTRWFSLALRLHREVEWKKPTVRASTQPVARHAYCVCSRPQSNWSGQWMRLFADTK